jgi:hypothetical protein
MEYTGIRKFNVHDNWKFDYYFIVQIYFDHYKCRRL